MDVERYYSLDVLRILSCLGVIMIHTSGSPIHHNLVEPGSMWFYECMILDGLVRWSVPVFAMLTGFFLLDPQKEITIKKLLFKYLLRIVSALIVWSVFYSVLLDKPFLPIGSQEGHFWYLQMLIGLYLSLPILRLVAKNQSVLSFFCMCWFGLMTYDFIGQFIELPLSFEYGVFGEYSGYCLCAYWLKAFFQEGNYCRNRYKWIVYSLGGIGLAITLIGGVLSSDGSTLFFKYTAPNVIATSLALFLLFMEDIRITRTPRFSGLVESVSKCTFGIYLIHLYILIQVFFRIHRYIHQPLLLSFLCVAIVFMGGLAIIWGIKRIPVLNKYIV